VTDKELIDLICKRCPKLENFSEGHRELLSVDQVFDRCLDIRDMIDNHRGRGDAWKQEEAGIDY
jgi:hypothetical protein